MRNFHLRRQHKFCPTINLDKLWSLVGVDKVAELEKEKSAKAPVIDLVKFVSCYFFLICKRIGNIEHEDSP